MLLAALGAAMILVPIGALAVRVPWGRVAAIAAEADTHSLVRLTLAAALATAAITTLVGVPFAIWISTLRRAAAIARGLVLLPLAMPPVVGGLALTAALGRRGLAAPILDALGLQFAFAFPGVVAAHVFVCLPFVVVAVDAALRQLDREIVDSARGVGMSRRAVLWRVMLPTIRPAIISGAGLAFARSLGEFGTTLTFAGSMPGTTRTMPIGIYLAREVDRDRAYALAAILIGLAVLSLALVILPTALRPRRRPRAVPLHDIDVERLQALSRPRGGPAGVTVRRGGATIAFPPGETTAIIGPNGSGKTTLMAIIAGRLVDDATRVETDGRVVLLTQRPGLPPKATAGNAVRMAGGTEELMRAAGLGELIDVPVTELSGGQAAQVALVRALAARPEVLILDEPLAAVDARSAARWRALLRTQANERTTLIVTHDPVELAGLSHRVAVVEAGRVVAVGATAEILAAPPTAFAASLAGVTRIEGRITAADEDTVTLTTSSGLEVVGVWGEGAGFSPAPPGAKAVATFPAEAASLALGDEATGERMSVRNRWPGRVIGVESAAGHVTVDVRVAGEILRVPITARSAMSLALGPGDPVLVGVKALAVRCTLR